ncbi:MAG: asparagine synthase (glutamine-hydrolyzing) [Bacteroidia bacterium]|nr:asparagine synthase (glutamine-hydrolyzing) [Bacteroidia bacterium]
MCGIVGAYFFTQNTVPEAKFYDALQTLHARGPDAKGLWYQFPVALGQTRLSIIDTSEKAHQPFWSADKRYVLVFNGEIFNFLELKKQLAQQGYTFQTQSDTEVLLYLLIAEKEKAIPKLNGFFAFAFYDTFTQQLLLARDRFGVKPLWIYQDADKLFFASELKALLALGIPREINSKDLWTYFQLNYFPPATSVLKGCLKFKAAHYAFVGPSQSNLQLQSYYNIPQPNYSQVQVTAQDYQKQQQTLAQLLEDAVQKRLIADVPLGVFLSGGIDSSVITALAAKHQKNLLTFSIGFDDPVYDETEYALSVSQKCGTEHTVFKVSYQDLLENIFNVLNYLDEPFADASALNFYILSQQTRKKATVALSGDGADEVFGGYMKHLGEYKARQKTITNRLLKLFHPVLQRLPAHRNSFFTRKIWQVQKYANGLDKDAVERYWQWCSVLSDTERDNLLQSQYHPKNFDLKHTYTRYIHSHAGIQDVLYADMHLTLQGDMLTKVDLMSMANSLEVRTPFLDYRVVDFAFSLPSESKVYKNYRKRIVQDTFKAILPQQLYHRRKQGFEVPLRDFFRRELKTYLHKEVLNRDWIESQGIFNFEALQHLYQTVEQGKNGKEDWTLWAVVVFDFWYKKYIAR